MNNEIISSNNNVVRFPTAREAIELDRDVSGVYSEAATAKKTLTVDEKIVVASQLAGITKEQAVSFCMLMKQL